MPYIIYVQIFIAEKVMPQDTSMANFESQYMDADSEVNVKSIESNFGANFGTEVSFLPFQLLIQL